MNAIFLHDTLCTHANFVNMYDLAKEASVDQVCEIQERMCKSNRFGAVTNLPGISEGEMISAYDEFRRRLLLIGFGEGVVAVLYERYQQGDEFFITCDLPDKLRYLGFPERITNAHLLELKNALENPKRKLNGDVTSLMHQALGTCSWSEYFAMKGVCIEWISQSKEAMTNLGNFINKFFEHFSYPEGAIYLHDPMKIEHENKVYVGGIELLRLDYIENRLRYDLAKHFISILPQMHGGQFGVRQFGEWNGMNLMLMIEKGKLVDAPSFYIYAEEPPKFSAL